MSIIAWDGISIAADRQSTYDSTVTTSVKLRKVGDKVVSFTGSRDHGIALTQWYIDGAIISGWPKFQESEDWVRLIVADKDGIIYYDRNPVPMTVIDKFMAWGSGSDLALGAMVMGASARTAVEVACRYSIYCGCGIDVVCLLTGEFV